MTLNSPVTYSPVDAQTTTFDVPAMVMFAFPFSAVVKLVVPFVRDVAVVAATPVN